MIPLLFYFTCCSFYFSLNLSGEFLIERYLTYKNKCNCLKTLQLLTFNTKNMDEKNRIKTNTLESLKQKHFRCLISIYNKI